MAKKSLDYQEAVLSTLKYFNQFNYPLDFEQLYLRFPLKISRAKLKDFLTTLVKNKVIERNSSFYTLFGQKQIVKTRLKREQISLAKKDQARDFIKLAKKLSLIKAVAVTGSLAANNAVEEDDLDFLIVTQKNTLWLTRLLVLFYSWWKKRRPNPGVNIKNAWDFNLWLEEDALPMSAQRQSLYEAYEILQVDWLLDKSKIKRQMRHHNLWMNSLLPNLKFPKKVKKFAPSTSTFLKMLNYLVYLVQKYYRQLRYGRQNINLKQAFFHNNVNKKLILKHQWQN